MVKDLKANLDLQLHDFGAQSVFLMLPSALERLENILKCR